MLHYVSDLIDMLPDLGLTHKHKEFTEVLEENRKVPDLRGKNVLVTGGTSGLGAAIAIAFAKRGASIYIAGRNGQAAEKVLQEAKQASNFPNEEKQVFQFHPFDAASIADCRRFGVEMQRLFEIMGGLNFLVMTQGGIGSSERKETADGNEWFLALHDISRYMIAAMLIPLLKYDSNGVVLDVLSAGVWNKFNDDDLQLHDKSTNFFNVASRDGPIHEIMTQEFNERVPAIRYNHLYPGPIKTAHGEGSVTGNSGSGWIISTGFAVAAKVIGQTAQEFSEIAYNVGTKWYQARTPRETCRTWGATGEAVKIRDYPRRPEVRKKIWDFLEQESGVVIQPDGTVKW